MRKLITLLLFLVSSSAFAQLTIAQLVILANGIKAETSPAIVVARQTRDDYTLFLWVNAASTTNVWNESVPSAVLVDASPLTLYDGLTQGKRDEWRLLLDYNQSMDMRNLTKRASIVDAWGTASRSVPILQAGLRFATHGELYFGIASTVTTNTVTGSVLNRPGNIELNDVSIALNNNP